MSAPWVSRRIKTVGDHHVDVVLLGSCARIVWQPTWLEVATWERYWCYYGPARAVAAEMAADAWDGADDTEPVGWEVASDGRRQLPT